MLVARRGQALWVSGAVEGVEERIAHVSLAEEIEGAPGVFGRVAVDGPEVDDLGLGEDQVLDFLLERRDHARPAHLGIELARDGQHGVADPLGVEPAAVHAAEERVLGIIGRQLGVGLDSTGDKSPRSPSSDEAA